MTPKWGFRVAMLPVGALCFLESTRRILGAQCFQNGHFGCTSSTLHFTVFQSLGGHASARRVSHNSCFRQAHCFMQWRLRFFPVLPNPTCAFDVFRLGILEKGRIANRQSQAFSERGHLLEGH